MYVEFLEGKKHAAKGADLAPSCEHFENAGYILKNTEIVVDIDNVSRDVLLKMLVFFKINTQIVWTDRGAHLYFKTCPIRTKNGICALGFGVEIKDAKNTPNGITVKRNGKMRVIENEGVREELPEFLKPNKKFDELLGLDDGEGRNNKLFEHRCKIETMKMRNSILRFINNFIFATPLEEDEFTTVIRDLKIRPDKDNEPQVAKQIMDKYKCVKYMGAVFFFYEGEYISDDDKLDRILFHELGDVKTRYVDEVKNLIARNCELIDINKTFDIKFKNGVLRDGRFIEVDYQEFTPYNINITYNPNAEPVDVVEQYLEHLSSGEKEFRDELLEMMAHCLITDRDFKRQMGRFYFLYGGGGNGKGTMLSVINKILGDVNCSSLDIDHLTKESYLVSMVGRLANLGDDVKDKPLDSDKMKYIKNISTCDKISVRKLYSHAVDVVLTTTLIFTSNHVLKSFEKGKSYQRRVRWLPILKIPKQKNPRFFSLLTSDAALEYWVRLVVEAYIRIYNTGEFTVSPMVEKYKEQYEHENNNLLLYLKFKEASDFEGKMLPEIIEPYETWARENGFEPHKQRLVSSTIKDKYGLQLVGERVKHLRTTKNVFRKIE